MTEPTAKPKALVLFSGGFDSVILLNEIIDRGFDAHVMFVNYEQKALALEFEAFAYWIKVLRLNEKFKVLRIPPISWSNSTMGENGISTGDSFKDEYVEMRNLIFLAYASSYAQAKGISHIFTGFINTEHYNDTNPSFVKGIDSLLFNAAGIEVQAPFNDLNKFELAAYAVDELGMSMEEILEHSVTCNTPVYDKPCGKCFGCQDIQKIRELFLK